MKWWVFLKGGRLIFSKGIQFWLVDLSPCIVAPEHFRLRGTSTSTTYTSLSTETKSVNRTEVFTGAKSFSETKLIVELAVNSFPYLL